MKSSTSEFTPRRFHLRQGPALPRPWLARIYLLASPIRLLAGMAAIVLFGALLAISIIQSDAMAQPVWQQAFYGLVAACGVMAACDLLLGDIGWWLIMEGLRAANRSIDEVDITINGIRMTGARLKLMGSKATNQQFTILCASADGHWLVIQVHQVLGAAIPGVPKYTQVSHDEAVTMLCDWKQEAVLAYL